VKGPIKTAVLIGVGILSFVFFLLLFFPLDAAVTQALSQLKDVRVSYSELRPSLIRWTVIKDLKVDLMSKDGFQEIFAADEVSIGLTVTKLSRTPVIPFEVSFGAKKGSFKGAIGLACLDKPVGRRGAKPQGCVIETRSLKLDFDKVDIGDLSVLKMFSGQGANLAGMIDGSLMANVIA
jgi:type II secretion system protein N